MEFTEQLCEALGLFVDCGVVLIALLLKLFYRLCVAYLDKNFCTRD